MAEVHLVAVAVDSMRLLGLLSVLRCMFVSRTSPTTAVCGPLLLASAARANAPPTLAEHSNGYRDCILYRARYSSRGALKASAVAAV